MEHAKRNYFEWDAMTYWQRQDYIRRFNKHQEELEKERKQQEAQLDAQFRRGR